VSAAATVNASMHGDKTVSGALALAMHVLFIILLVFGVSWQKRAETPVVAELWSTLPPLPQPKVVLPPEPVPEPPKPAPKVEPTPPPKVEPKPVTKPDIALKKKEKAEKEKKKEPPPKAEPVKDDKAEKAAAEKLRLAKEKEAEAKKKRDEEIKRDLDLIRKENEMEAKAAAEKAAQASAQSKLINEYTERIKTKIRSQIIEPPGLQGSPEAEFDVVLIPGGEVLTAKLRKSSGVPAYDAAVERAIMKAQPLPLPPDPTMFSRFRELRLTIRPK
jgi:colicin import membrane protein